MTDATAARIDAIELLLQQLLFLLEVEPQPTAATALAWLRTCERHMRSHQTASPQALDALDKLIERMAPQKAAQ